MNKILKMHNYNRVFKASLLKFSFLFMGAFLLSNCTSVARYNQQLDEPIPTEKLLKDVDYVHQKMIRLHPSLYKYISKEKLNSKFDSLKKVITQPLTSKEFYFLMSPIVASVRQGHMILVPPVKRLTKEEQNRLSKLGLGPLSQFDFEWMNDKLYVVKNKSKQKTIQNGAEVISINSITPQFIFDKYRKTYTSDGFNKTYMSRGFSRRFTTYLTNEIGINDSLTYVFKQNDSLKEMVVSRLKSEKKIKTIGAEKVKVESKKNVISKRDKRIYGFDEKTKLCSIDLSFASKDSSIAVLKLRDFSKGNFRKAFAEIFEKLKEKKAASLVIDLRNNPGGRVAEVVDLYSYVTDTSFVMLQNAEVTSKMSLWKLGLFAKIPKVSYPFAAAFYPAYMLFSTLRTKKQSDGTYTYSLIGSKERKCKPNHFSGKIYVIINGGSFSASCLLASSLKANKKITFVGEETGGGFNSTVAGLLPVLKLPNSKLFWRLGLMDVKTTNQSEVFGRGIFPDIEILPTLQDKINTVDPEMNWILNDLNSKNQ